MRSSRLDPDGRPTAGGVAQSRSAAGGGAARNLDGASSAAGDTRARDHRYVDFAHIKRAVSLAMLLSRYGVSSSMRPLGRQHSTICPIHGGSDPRQFVVNLGSSQWFCFSPQCNRGGGVIDFVMLREGVDARRAAELIADWFAIGPPRHLPPRPHLKRSSLMDSSKPSHNIFVVENREADGDAEHGGFWTKIGVAWPHKDGKGLNLQIKPNIAVSGRLVLREWNDDERGKSK